MAVFHLLLLALSAFPSTPYGPSDAKSWMQSMEAQCPGNHVQEWMSEGGQVDLLDSFIATRGSMEQAKFRRVANVRRVCASEKAGQSCEKIVELHGVRALGLLEQFSQFACKHATCSELAVCEPPY